MAESKQLKIVKKKWLQIRASKFFNNEFLGECYVPNAESLLGRTVTANLGNLTGDIRQQSVSIKFVVTSIESDAGIADVVGYEMAGSAVRRIVRRGSDRIDESFICETGDGRPVRIKPMIITKAVTNSAAHNALRKALMSNVVKHVKAHTFDSLINEIITSKLQTAVKAELKRIYPLKAVEVRSLELVSGRKKGEKDREAATDMTGMTAAEGAEKGAEEAEEAATGMTAAETTAETASAAAEQQ